MQTYRAITDHGAALYGEDVFEKDWSPSEEKDQLDSGHVEIAPRDYRVLSDNFSGGPTGATYRAALRREIEEALISGSHIARVDDTPPEPVELEEEDTEEL